MLRNLLLKLNSESLSFDFRKILALEDVLGRGLTLRRFDASSVYKSLAFAISRATGGDETVKGKACEFGSMS